MIARSKREKSDKLLAQEERQNITVCLDEKWKELVRTGAMSSFIRDAKDTSLQSEDDDYGKVVCIQFTSILFSLIFVLKMLMSTTNEMVMMARILFAAFIHYDVYLLYIIQKYGPL